MPITQVRYSDDSLMFATCSQDGTVKIWDAVNFVCVRTLEGVHGGNMVSSVCFSHDCSLLLTSGLDSTARVWDISSGREVISFAETHQLVYFSLHYI